MSNEIVKKVKQPVETRKQYILDHVAQLTQTELARDMGVSRMQISRDIKVLKESGVWEEWLENELIRLHLSSEIDEITKYREIAKLYARTITQRREVETTADLNVNFNVWRPHLDVSEAEVEFVVDDDDNDPDKLLPT